MYKLNESQTLLVSGGELFIVTEEWKQEIYYKNIVVNALGCATFCCLAMLWQCGLSVNAALGGFATGAVFGALSGLYRSDQLYHMYEVGTYYELK